ncbi:hypothetical protein [Rhizobium sp. NRK18]|uniref:hypothetical protein n=1 Tax=Rhizobium sp. NRK18 TaxID=2964667 RepID=UPI0021C485EC|nr:hypothetical protein [Rhizobium sp. NRK18]MCQ2003685.1 hypothetical protein [Rhizobium sp. NRK18]
MTNFIAKAGIAALVSIAAVTGIASTASARDTGYGFGIYIDSPGYHDGYRDGDGRWGGRGDGRWGDDGRDYGRDFGRRPACRPWQAVDKAERFGVRNAHVVDMSRRAVVVDGRRHHRPVRIVFANVPGCPVIR